MEKRIVTDILDAAGPVAFNQHNQGGELVYEGICPWCAQAVGKRFKAETYGELYTALLVVQAGHMAVCPQSLATEMAVVAGGGIDEHSA